RGPSAAPTQPSASAVTGASARNSAGLTKPMPGPSTRPTTTSGPPAATTGSRLATRRHGGRGSWVASRPIAASPASASTGLTFTRERSRALDAGARRRIACLTHASVLLGHGRPTAQRHRPSGGQQERGTHLLALEPLGAQVTARAAYHVEASRLVGTDIFRVEPSVTATESALMAAVAARGRTTLRNAACEPHVQDLARFLTSLGADVQGIGTNTLTVEGGRPLKGAAFALGPDHIEIGSFIGLAAVTNGAITIEGVRGEDLRATLLAFERLGVRPRQIGRAHV